MWHQTSIARRLEKTHLQPQAQAERAKGGKAINSQANPTGTLPPARLHPVRFQTSPNSATNHETE